MYNAFYSLASNPFDKQQLSEKDCFKSHDFTEMISRLDYLKDIHGIGLFTASPGMGKSYALRCFAKSLNPNSPEVATNEALLALANGNVEGAEAALAKGNGANSYSEILGNLNLAKGNYAAAAANLSGINTNSAALAQILNQDYAAATRTLNNIKNADAYTSYLKAVLAARQGDGGAVEEALRSAIQQNPSLAARAAKDLEFEKYAALISSLVK